MYPPLKHSLLSRRAFTLTELLVVIVIIAILAVIALPVYSSFTARAAETKTLSNMRQMGSAMLLYSNDNFNQLPGRVTSNKWPTLLKPYVQNYAMYSSPIPDVNGKSYKVTDPTVYFEDDKNYTSYIYNGFNDMGAFTDTSYTPRINQIALPSATIMLGIPYPQTGQFYMDFVEGGGNNNDILNRTAFVNGCVYVFCDGSARVLKYSATTDEKSQPVSSGDYADWYWLMDKSRTSIIQ